MKGFIGILLIVCIGLLSMFSSRQMICDPIPAKVAETAVSTPLDNKKAGDHKILKKEARKLTLLEYSNKDFHPAEHSGNLNQNAFRASFQNLQRWKDTISKGLLKICERLTGVSSVETQRAFYHARTARAPIYVVAIRQLLI